MSRTTVRAAVATYLDGHVVPNLREVHPAKPRNWKPSEWRMTTASPTTANGYVHVESSAEERAALGKKAIRYEVVVVLAMRTRETDAELRMAAWDTIIDGVKARLRTKPPLLGGTADAAIFDAAEDLLEDESDLPQDEPAGAVVWGLVRFDVHEMIDG